MIDISRNKIPQLETLYRIIDLISDLKFNQLQLYIEGSPFAYESFPQVWELETPLTGEEILLIDAYCRERYIELVPNQNSFGHMEHWLSRPEFNHLAEIPGGFMTPAHFDRLEAYISSIEDRLEALTLACADAALVREELDNGIHFVKHAVQLGRLKQSLAASPGEVDPARVKGLIKDLDRLLHNYPQLWNPRNRPGGLEQSLSKLVRLRSEYEALI